ncbi:MAG: hypothetical protein IPP83_11440 [Flavobacteriales bacterium]|nr:hypothetical protein [Flavobacteriales bacterium]
MEVSERPRHICTSEHRWFLDRICTHDLSRLSGILAFDSHNNVYWFEGNFQDYEENRKKRVGPPLLRRTSSQ